MAQALLNPTVGESWTAPYYRFVRFSDLMIPNSSTGALATNTAWEDSGYDLTLDTDAGCYPFDLPSDVEGITEGKWLVAFYEKAGAAYASTDTYLGKMDLCNGELVNNVFDFPPSPTRLRR